MNSYHKTINEEDIRKIILDLLDKDVAINIDTQLNEIGIDSLKYVELVIKLEEHYDIEITDNDLHIGNFINIYKIIQLLDQYLIKDKGGVGIENKI
ncbi:acyl carrier protein [Bacillus fungorum]|uniref:acyl carrier protein n=1 Tax=Bacillus fungorum TaxID=2039284 RepID=UPI0033977DB7